MKFPWALNFLSVLGRPIQPAQPPTSVSASGKMKPRQKQFNFNWTQFWNYDSCPHFACCPPPKSPYHWTAARTKLNNYLKSNCCKFIVSTFMRVLSYNRFITEQPDFLFYSQSIILNLTVLLINNLYLNLCWKVEQVQWHKGKGNQNTYFFAYFPNPIPRLLYFFNEKVT